MTLGMAMVSGVRQHSRVVRHGAWSLVLGIGGMLAANNAVAAEFSNARRRGFCACR